MRSGSVSATTTFIPGVIELRRPAGRRQAPVMLDSPHSGGALPPDFGAIVPDDALRRVQDIYVDELFAEAPSAGASLLRALFPRSYIDPNRAETDIDSRLLESAWPGPLQPTDKSRLGHGLIWRTCPTDRRMYDRRLTVTEVERRIKHYWRPYHRALAGELDRLHGEFGAVWHIDCHSMPSGSSPIVSRRGGMRRADMVLGDRDGASCHADFTAFLRERLEAMGYVVRLNEPYKGAELISAYADPAAGRHSIQIEINRGLYVDEISLKKHDGFDALRADMTRLIVDVSDFARSHSLRDAAE